MQLLPGEPDPRENLTKTRAIEKIRKLAKSARTCLFGTHVGRTLAVRPMAVQDVDRQGNLWFLSGRTSAHNRQIARNPRVQLIFANTSSSEFLNLHGIATISTDRALLRRHWTPIAKTWFHEGLDDPEATVVKVRIESGHYWDTRYGKVVSLFEVAVGALTGHSFDGGVEGSIRPKPRNAKRRPKRK